MSPMETKLMKLSIFQIQHKFQSLLSAMIVTSLFAACAETPKTETNLSDAEICEKIKNIIAKYPSKYADLRQGTKTNNPLQQADIWNAKTFFPGTECQVWEWASGLANYSCQWRESGEESANAIYDKHKPKLDSCLGMEWSGIEEQTPNGRQTQYRKDGEKVVVSIRVFQHRRSLLNRWWTSLVIGDPIQTVKAPRKHTTK